MYNKLDSYYKMLPNSDKRDRGEKLCIFANSVCVFGICLCIGVLANSSVVEPEKKKNHWYQEGKSVRDLVLSFDIENQLKLFIFVLLATVGNFMEMPWLMIPWLKHTACLLIQHSFDHFYQSSNPYFLISYTFNGIVLRAIWFKMLILFLKELTIYVKKRTDSLVPMHEQELEIK